MKYLLTVSLIMLLCTLPGFCQDSDQKEEDVTITLNPVIQNDTESEKYTAGIEFDLYGKYEPFTGEAVTYRKSVVVAGNAGGLLTLDKKLNSTHLRGAITLGGAINLSGPKISERGDQEGEEVIIQQPFDYGRLNGGFNAGYETDQALDNRNLTIGLKLTYVYLQHQGWKMLIPSIHTWYEYVQMDKTTLLADPENYERFRVAASWKAPVGDWLPDPFAPLSLHLDARYFMDVERAEAIETADMDQSHYVAAYLNYTLPNPLLGDFISGVYLKVSDGGIPPVVVETTRLHLGIVFFEK